MLSLLAKIRNSTENTTNFNSSASESQNMMDVDDEPITMESVKDDLVALSAQVDIQSKKLFTLVEGGASAPEDCSVIDEIAQTFANELKEIETSLSHMETVVADEQKETENLIRSIRGWIRAHTAEPVGTPTQQGTPNGQTAMPQSTSKFMTPLRQKGTPKTSRRGSGIDFDAFPQTPTLEQIGLSKGALEAVGFAYRRQAVTSNLKQNTAASDSDLVAPRSRPSFGSNSESITSTNPSYSACLTAVAPRLAYLQSSSSSNIGSGPVLATRMSEISSDQSKMVPTAAISSTPTVANSCDHTSPFGATIFGGRPSDAFASGLESEF